MTDTARDKAWAEWREAHNIPDTGVMTAARVAAWDAATQVNSAELAEARAALAERDATIAAVRALADEWRYKGEFGWGAWQEGQGPDLEGQVLDECAGRLRALLPAVDAGR